MPTLEAFIPLDLPDKPWGRELLVAHTPEYTGKVLWMRAGHRGALQYHEHKDETFFLFSGEALVTRQAKAPFTSGYETLRMQAGESYHVPIGAHHQVEAVTDCVFFEASTPSFDDRVIVGSPAR